MNEASSFGPAPDWRKCKLGMCRECFDRNNALDNHHFMGDGKILAVCPKCKRRLHKPKRRPEPTFKWNLFIYGNRKTWR